MKAKKQKVGYLFVFEAKPIQTDIQFAKFHNIKLTPYLNIYSKRNDIFSINKILNNRYRWPYDNEIKYLKYEYIKTVKITNSKLILIRQSTFWQIEKREVPDFINGENVVTYTCFTNLHHLKYLNKEYEVKEWVFTDKVKGQPHLLKNPLHYNKLIRKGRVIVKHPVVAKQCLKLRSKKGHTIEFVTDKTFIKKHVTKPNEIRKPISNKLVCITDGISVVRVKQIDADERIKKYPSLHYCTKAEYYKYLNEMRTKPRTKYKDTIKDRTPKLSVQGSKESVNVETGKKSDTRTRRERRISLQKKNKFSRYYKSQFITGKWVVNPDGKTETFVETGEHKLISHHIKPQKSTRQWYNPLKRKQAIPYEEEEKQVKRIVISKFPYNKEIVVNYKTVGEEDLIIHKKLEHCKMLNRTIIQEQPIKRKLKDGTEIDDTEQIVICSLKDVESWMNQEDYPTDMNAKIDSTKWIPYISIKTDTKVIKHKPEFKLLRKQQKTKLWKHPIKQPWWERRGLAPF